MKLEWYKLPHDVKAILIDDMTFDYLDDEGYANVKEVLLDFQDEKHPYYLQAVSQYENMTHDRVLQAISFVEMNLIRRLDYVKEFHEKFLNYR